MVFDTPTGKGVPRYPGAPREYRGVHVDEWPETPHGGPEAIAALYERVRTFIVRLL